VCVLEVISVKDNALVCKIKGQVRPFFRKQNYWLTGSMGETNLVKHIWITPGDVCYTESCLLDSRSNLLHDESGAGEFVSSHSHKTLSLTAGPISFLYTESNFSSNGIRTKQSRDVASMIGD